MLTVHKRRSSYEYKKRKNIDSRKFSKKIGGGRRHKIWIASTLILTICSLVLFASITVYFDPFFHYHAPLEQYEYPLNNEVYQNDGIMRNFEYDSIITGNSMIQNFKTSEADRIFGASFIKVPFSGEYYKRINENLEQAYASGKNIRYIIRCIDSGRLIQNKDIYKYTDYPHYLYNEDLFDDLNYILNKSIFKNTLNIIKYTRAGNKTTSFDDYSNWNDDYTFGAESVLKTYKLGKKAAIKKALTEKERTMIRENIRQNVTALMEDHPETTFYIFFAPYSICYWDVQNNEGSIDYRIDAEKLAIEEILKMPNVKLYSFSNNFELICNLDNYKDAGHYGEWVNSSMLEWMYKDEYRLTKDNYQEYIETIRDFYNSYDYDSLRK